MDLMTPLTLSQLLKLTTTYLVSPFTYSSSLFFRVLPLLPSQTELIPWGQERWDMDIQRGSRGWMS